MSSLAPVLRIRESAEREILTDAVSEGDVDKVIRIIEEDGCDINAHDKFGRRPIDIAAKNKDWDMLSVIVSAQAKDLDSALQAVPIDDTLEAKGCFNLLINAGGNFSKIPFPSLNEAKRSPKTASKRGLVVDVFTPEDTMAATWWEIVRAGHLCEKNRAIAKDRTGQLICRIFSLPDYMCECILGHLFTGVTVCGEDRISVLPDWPKKVPRGWYRYSRLTSNTVRKKWIQKHPVFKKTFWQEPHPELKHCGPGNAIITGIRKKKSKGESRPGSTDARSASKKKARTAKKSPNISRVPAYGVGLKAARFHDQPVRVSDHVGYDCLATG